MDDTSKYLASRSAVLGVVLHPCYDDLADCMCVLTFFKHPSQLIRPNYEPMLIRDPVNHRSDQSMTVDELYGTYASSLLAHARYLTRDRDQADDLFQDTFIRAMKHLDLLGSLSPPRRRAWLYRTMANLFVDKTRARQREAMFLDTWLQLMREEFSYTSGWESGPGDHPGVSATMPEIMKHVPEKHRGLVHMRFVLGLTSREIAERTGIPAGTVRFRLHAAIRKLRARISHLT